MQVQTPLSNQLYTKTYSDSKLLNVINHSVNAFCQKMGFQKGYFSKFLPYSETQSLKFLNPNNNEKNLKVLDLEIILSHLDSFHKKLILDSLCHQNGFVCVESATCSDNGIYKSIETLLLTISATNGELAANFLKAVQDGNINDLEKDSLNKIAYDLRAFLVLFESRIKETE